MRAFRILLVVLVIGMGIAHSTAVLVEAEGGVDEDDDHRDLSEFLGHDADALSGNHGQLQNSTFVFSGLIDFTGMQEKNAAMSDDVFQRTLGEDVIGRFDGQRSFEDEEVDLDEDRNLQTFQLIYFEPSGPTHAEIHVDEFVAEVRRRQATFAKAVPAPLPPGIHIMAIVVLSAALIAGKRRKILHRSKSSRPRP